MAKKKEWREGEMILTFKLNKIENVYTTVMTEWLMVAQPSFTDSEQYIFEKTYNKGLKKLQYWSEENLKMQFISPVLELGQILDSDKFVSFFDKSLNGEYDGYKLSVKADFVVGAGLLDYMQVPYFHFQEYKPDRNPTGDPMAQLLEAFLIGQSENLKKNIHLPLYGCEIVGANWRFVTMEDRSYCVSKNYDCTDREDLLQIIAILRKFREILETRLLV
jgi:hypothetical protein